MDHTTFRVDLNRIMNGMVPVPNYKDVEIAHGLGIIASSGSFEHDNVVYNAVIPGHEGKHWARFFLSTTHGGRLDGGGMIVWWHQGKGRIGRFAICEHEKVAAAGANPSRGWHPGSCGKCGLDMTVDSGD